MLKQPVFVKLAGLWILALMIGSLLPQTIKVALGTSTAEGQAVVVRVVWIHGLVHYAAFGSTAVLLIAISSKAWQRYTPLLATIALGVGIELIQHFFYRSDLEWRDIRDDTLGASAGYLIWHVMQWLSLRRHFASLRASTSLSFSTTFCRPEDPAILVTVSESIKPTN